MKKSPLLRYVAAFSIFLLASASVSASSGRLNSSYDTNPPTVAIVNRQASGILYNTCRSFYPKTLVYILGIAVVVCAYRTYTSSSKLDSRKSAISQGEEEHTHMPSTLSAAMLQTNINTLDGSCVPSPIEGDKPELGVETVIPPIKDQENTATSALVGSLNKSMWRPVMFLSQQFSLQLVPFSITFAFIVINAIVYYLSRSAQLNSIGQPRAIHNKAIERFHEVAAREIPVGQSLVESGSLLRKFLKPATGAILLGGLLSYKFGLSLVGSTVSEKVVKSGVSSQKQMADIHPCWEGFGKIVLGGTWALFSALYKGKGKLPPLPPCSP